MYCYIKKEIGLSRPKIGLVVPSLEQSGGVPAVAEFLWQVIQRTERFDVRLVSLSCSAVDDVSVAISQPASWLRGVQVVPGTWHGRPFKRVGVFASEFEFQRYRPRAALAKVLKLVSDMPINALRPPVNIPVAAPFMVSLRHHTAMKSSGK